MTRFRMLICFGPTPREQHLEAALRTMIDVAQLSRDTLIAAAPELGFALSIENAARQSPSARAVQKMDAVMDRAIETCTSVLGDSA